MNTRMAAVAHGHKSSVRWRIFWFLLVLITINYVDRASLSVAMPLISKEFSLSPVVQGLILSSFFWSYTIMQIPSGMLVDRFCRPHRDHGCDARPGDAFRPALDSARMLFHCC